jgi:putative ABC transport system ATP-binding protein
VTSPDESPIVELTAATKSFAVPGGQTFHALKGISVRIAAGEHVAVLGKSGSGKSTLLNLIAGLDRPTSGEVHVAGARLTELTENQLASWRGGNLGVVFQFFQLLPTLTVEENIVLAMDFVGKVPAARRRARARELLALVDLADQALKLPATLSGGQQQRAAIARALANDPRLVVADEPTGNLDSETAAAVTTLFRALVREGKTLLVVTHDASVARDAHRVIELQDGLVAGDTSAVRA